MVPPDPTAAAPPARPGPAPPREAHQVGDADWLEEAVFGTLDGVITSLALVVTLSAVLSEAPHTVFLTVVAASVAGTLSMFVGALLSARSRSNLIRRERAREEWEVDHLPEVERREVEEIYRHRGFSEEEVRILVARVTADKERWVDMMMRDELGLDPHAPPRALRHAGVIGVSYLIGGGILALPYLFTSAPTQTFYGHPLGLDFLVSLGLGGLVLATVGILEAGFAGTHRARSAVEIVAIGFATAVAVFLVTTLLAPA